MMPLGLAGGDNSTTARRAPVKENFGASTDDGADGWLGCFFLNENEMLTVDGNNVSQQME